MVPIYCDGSVNGGCGAVIREYFEEGVYTDEHVSKKLGHFFVHHNCRTSSYIEGLLVTSLKGKDIYVFVDSQSAFFSFNSVNTVNSALVSQCKAIVFQLKIVGMLCSSCGYHLILVFVSMKLVPSLQRRH